MEKTGRFLTGFTDQDEALNESRFQPSYPGRGSTVLVRLSTKHVAYRTKLGSSGILVAGPPKPKCSDHRMALVYKNTRPK